MSCLLCSLLLTASHLPLRLIHTDNSGIGVCAVGGGNDLFFLLCRGKHLGSERLGDFPDITQSLAELEMEPSL